MATVVQKYGACAEFDAVTGECLQILWVDAPGFLPYLSPEMAVAFAGMIGVLWICVAAFHPIQDAARDA